jgi:hypothetical protein
MQCSTELFRIMHPSSDVHHRATMPAPPSFTSTSCKRLILQTEVQHSRFAAELHTQFDTLPYPPHAAMLAVLLELLEDGKVSAAFESRGARQQAVVLSVADDVSSSGAGVGGGGMSRGLGAGAAYEAAAPYAERGAGHGQLGQHHARPPPRPPPTGSVPSYGVRCAVQPRNAALAACCSCVRVAAT